MPPSSQDRCRDLAPPAPALTPVAAGRPPYAGIVSTAALPTPRRRRPRTAGGPRCVVRTVAARRPRPPARAAARRAPGRVRSSRWVRRGEGLVGWGVAAECRTRGPDRFAQAQAWWTGVAAHASVRDEVGLPGSGPVAFGSFAFADDSAEEARLVVPEVDRRAPRRALVGDDRRRRRRGLAPARSSPPAPEPRAAVRRRVRRRGAWSRCSGRARSPRPCAGSTRGELDKVVLARDLRRRRAAPGRRALAAAAAGRALRHGWTFAVDGLVGATPELLVRRERGPGHLPRAGRHDPADRRRRPRPRAGRRPGPLEQGPRGARVRRPLGRRRAGARTARR